MFKASGKKNSGERRVDELKKKRGSKKGAKKKRGRLKRKKDRTYSRSKKIFMQ